MLGELQSIMTRIAENQRFSRTASAQKARMSFDEQKPSTPILPAFGQASALVGLTQGNANSFIA